MKLIQALTLTLIFLGLSSCVIEGSNDCEQDLSGTYMGTETTPWVLGDRRQEVTLVITGAEGEYVVTSPTGSALREDELEQEGCGFEYSGSLSGDKGSGEVTIEGDSLWYQTSGNSFGGLPSSFVGVKQ